MSVSYSLSEKGSAGQGPVRREVAVGNAVGDSTGWLPVGKSTPFIEIRRVSLDGTRTETLVGQDSRTVARYVKDQDGVAYASVVSIQYKQSHEDDDQAATLDSVTGLAYMQVMSQAEMGDLLRITVTAAAPGEEMFMAVSARLT